MREKIFIGVAWPYANGSLHLGHLAGCYLPADIFARFCRMNGKDVLMVSGSDEHGTPITITAEREGVSPQEVVDRFHKEHKENMEKLGISFDLFTRTSSDFHKEVVKDFVRRLYERGLIYEKESDAFYCENCKRFLPDRYIEGKCPHCGYEGARGDQCDECGKLLDPKDVINPKCKVCGSKPVIRRTRHLFFALSRFEKRLLDWMEEKTYWRSNVKRFTENWIKGGLKDRAITRDINWGVEVPIKGYEDKRIYVWFDAVIGYLSASKEWAKMRGNPDKWEDWWKDKKVKHYYFLAKDNIPFHTIIWPSMLMGYDDNLNLPYDVPANEYLRLEGEQFSKSRGLAIWIPDVLKRFDVDPIRYYLSINMPEQRDSNWRWEDFVSKNNDELVGIYGNLVHRVLTFSWKNFGRVPPVKVLDDADKDLIAEIEKTFRSAKHELEGCSFKKAIKEIISLAQKGNVYFAHKKPWEGLKIDKDMCATTIHLCLRLVRSLAIMFAPFLPFSSEKIWGYLGYNDSIFSHHWSEALDDIENGLELRKPGILFEKLSLEDIIPREETFSSLDIRVGEVLDVKDHPNADKLYVLKVNLGEKGERIIVAGLKEFYKKEEMKGKRILVLTNLKPAKFRGIESRGMLLAADDGKNVSLLLADAEPGEIVKAEGIDTIPKDMIEIEEFRRLDIRVDEKGNVVYKGRLLRAGKGPVRLDRKLEKNAKVL